MLAMANTDLSNYQLNALSMIYNENESLVNLLGLQDQVPTLSNLVKRHNEVIYLEKLYKDSPNEESEGSTGQTTQTVEGNTRVVDS